MSFLLKLNALTPFTFGFSFPAVLDDEFFVGLALMNDMIVPDLSMVLGEQIVLLQFTVVNVNVVKFIESFVEMVLRSIAVEMAACRLLVAAS